MNRVEICPAAEGKEKAFLPLEGGGRLPVWTVQGAADGPTLALTAGVHGGEYVGILALRRLFAEADPRKLQGRLVLLPLVNRDGFYAGAKGVVPEDGKNLNRVFPAAPGGTQAEQLAWAIQEQVYPEADFLLDLHGGDVNEAMTPLVFFPSTAAPAVAERSREAAAHLEVGYRIPSTAKDGLYSCAAHRGIPALLMEVGGLGRWSEAEVEGELRSLRSLMGFLGMGGEPRRNREQREPREMAYEEASASGLWFPRVQPGQPVRRGQVLGQLEDLDGRLLQTVAARWDGTVLYHTVSLGVAAGDALVAYGPC